MLTSQKIRVRLLSKTKFFQKLSEGQQRPTYQLAIFGAGLLFNKEIHLLFLNTFLIMYSPTVISTYFAVPFFPSTSDHESHNDTLFDTCFLSKISY